MTEQATDAFKDIRGYHDHEVPQVMRRLSASEKLARLVLGLLLPKSLRTPFVMRSLLPLVRLYLRVRLRFVRTVRDLQVGFVKPCVINTIENSCTACTCSGLEALDIDSPYLLISNHRDILFDPVLTDYTRYKWGGDTVRIAVGDNLMVDEVANDLVRLNKGIMVRRSFESPRVALQWHKHFAAYLRQSVVEDRCSVWIAQASGRSKDGNDRTDTGLIKMLALPMRANPGSDFASYIRSMNIVPTSISYEYDPGDVLKAREVYIQQSQAEYVKSEGEDDYSIVTGILGDKGRVHLHYGTPLQDDYHSPAEVAQALDRAIQGNYVLFPSNYFAYRALYGDYPRGDWGFPARPFDPGEVQDERARFEERIDAVDERYRPYVLRMYANPLVNKLALQGSGEEVQRATDGRAA